MLTRERIRLFSILLIAVMSLSFILLRWTAVDGIDRAGNTLFPDFGQLYISGKYFLTGNPEKMYERDVFFREVNQTLRQEGAEGFYPVYPPIAGMLAAPFALLSYSHAAWLHAAMSIALAIGLARSMSRLIGDNLDDQFTAMLLFLAFLPLWRVFLFGQNSLWALGLMWGSWRFYEKGRMLQAGLLLSIGLFKPQLFVGVWLWCLIWGNHRLRLGLVFGGMIGFLLPMLFGGIQIWGAWIQSIRQTVGFVEKIEWMTSLPHAWRLMGAENLLGIRPIYFLMGGLAIAWLIVLTRIKLQSKNPIYGLVLVIVGSLILSPRLYVYDWILVWPLMLLAWRTGDVRIRQAITFLGPLFWIHDFFGMLHIPILSVVFVLIFIWLMWRMNTSLRTATTFS